MAQAHSRTSLDEKLREHSAVVVAAVEGAPPVVHQAVRRGVSARCACNQPCKHRPYTDRRPNLHDSHASGPKYQDEHRSETRSACPSSPQLGVCRLSLATAAPATKSRLERSTKPTVRALHHLQLPLLNRRTHNPQHHPQAILTRVTTQTNRACQNCPGTPENWPHLPQLARPCHAAQHQAPTRTTPQTPRVTAIPATIQRRHWTAAATALQFQKGQDQTAR